VIVERDVVLRKGNGEGFAPQVAEKLTPGVECLILEARPDWLRVRLGDGTEGWVRDTTLVRVARSA
jgi:SH3-like domain-containing protein